MTNDTVIAWHFILVDEDFNLCLSFLRAAVKHSIFSSDFAPTPQCFLAEMAKASKERHDPEAAFDAGPNAANSELLKATWRRWGGVRTWGMLPDIKYSTNPDQALTTWRFERKRFVEIYKALSEGQQREQFTLTYEQSKAAIAALNGELTTQKSVERIA